MKNPGPDGLNLCIYVFIYMLGGEMKCWSILFFSLTVTFCFPPPKNIYIHVNIKDVEVQPRIRIRAA